MTPGRTFSVPGFQQCVRPGHFEGSSVAVRKGEVSKQLHSEIINHGKCARALEELKGKYGGNVTFVSTKSSTKNSLVEAILT